MIYEYSGFLKTILYGPDPVIRDQLDHVLFTADDLASWQNADDTARGEWQRVPVSHSRTERGVRIVGRFENVHAIDSLSPDDPSMWVPLTSEGLVDHRFPVDLRRYPVAELTYRCNTENARPAWVWGHAGGVHFDGLEPTRRWRTIVRLLRHRDEPTRLDYVTFRLYSTSRSTESFEVESLRFRAMSPAEEEAVGKEEIRLAEEAAPPAYESLAETLPLGVHMSAEVSRRLAEMLGVTLSEYWALAFEDVSRHHHNMVMMQHIEQLTAEEWREALDIAQRTHVQLIGQLRLAEGDDEHVLREVVEDHVAPHRDAEALFAWSLYEEPPEHLLPYILRARQLVHEADPKHPLVVLAREASGYPFMGPYLAASGIKHFASHDPWRATGLVRHHSRVCGGQQFWMTGPAFVYGTRTPEWSTTPELRLLVNLAFANGARGYFSYCYHNDPIWVSGSTQRTLTGPFLAFSDLWLELDKRMERFNALAPMLLQAKPAPLPRRWYIDQVEAAENARVPEGITPVGSFHLRGPDYSLFFLVSHGAQGMTSLNVDIPPEAMRGFEIYDLTDFINDHVWQTMPLRRHLEMFPGQARVLLSAPPEVCRHWRNILTERLVADDQRSLEFHLGLARTYGLDTTAIDDLIGRTEGSEDVMESLALMDRARDLLVNLTYECDAISHARSRIIEATSAVCACDGALCRLVNRGRGEEANQWGRRVIPLAREFTQLRLELRAGRGEAIVEHSEGLVRRALRLLGEIRGLID